MSSGSPKSLENHAVLGTAKLRQTLTKTRKINTLINAVKRFQDDNGIKMDTLSPALQLLDLHKVKRRDFYEQAAADISEHVVARIRALGENGSPESIRKLEDQLEKCFDLFALPQFSHIVLENLKQIPKLPDKYLDSIVLDRKFYEACPLTVKQQIWLKNDGLFKEAFSPHIDSYLKRKKDLLSSTEVTTTNFFTFETTKARRQWKEIKDLAMSMGNHDELFLSVTAYIRELFASTGDAMLCSLRYELIMAAHDASIEGIVKADPCHDFAWCLEACMRDKHLESHQANKLRHILDTFPKAVHEGGAHLPRDMPSIVVLVRVLSLGCCAKDLVSRKVQPTDVVDSIFVTKFLPEFTSLMVEDCIRAELMRSNNDLGEEFVVSNYLSKPTERLITFLKASRLASLLWYHCCLDMLPSKKRIGDLRGLSRYAEALPFLREHIASSGVWCHLLFQRLVYSNQYEAALTDTNIYAAVIEQVLLKNLGRDSCAKYQLLKLISQIGYIWGQPHCVGLMKEYDIEYFTNAGHEDIDLFAVEYNKLRERLMPKPVELMDVEHEQISPPKQVPGVAPLQPPPAQPLHFSPFHGGVPHHSY